MNKIKKTLVAITLLLISQFSFGQNKISPQVFKELVAAESKMFDGIVQHNPEFWKNYVHKDYLTINADGVMQTKEEAIADSARKNMFAGITYQVFDRNIRLYGNIAILNGRSHYFMGDKMMAAVYHTEIWLKEKGKWMFNGWQGTYTKGSQAKLTTN